MPAPRLCGSLLHNLRQSYRAIRGGVLLDGDIDAKANDGLGYLPGGLQNPPC